MIRPRASRARRRRAASASDGARRAHRQVTTQANGGMGGAWFTNLLMYFSQSAEDGTMPLLRCMATPDAQSGEFYEPRGGIAGPAAKTPLEKLCTDAAARAMLWEESTKAVGKFEL